MYIVIMARFRSKYVCQQCGYSQIGWAGKCPECGSWGSLVETVVEENKKGMRRGGKTSNINSISPITLDKIPIRATTRISTKISELDRVLGGGLIKGQATLIAGEPGIGKSTLLMKLAGNLGRVLYVSGEESAGQIKLRANRLGVKNPKLLFLEETDVDAIDDAIYSSKEDFTAVIIDSIQTMQTTDLTGLAGSIGQVRECTFRLLKACKKLGFPLFIVGHVTKEGTVAGPSVLMHIVDTVLWFEGDKTTTLRILRAVKNRFGPTDEVGVFEMEEKGLISQTNAEKIFLTSLRKVIPGSVVSSILQGSRPLLVEIQSLVTSSKSAFPKRVAQGIDPKRFEILIAILIRRCGIPLYDYDVFVNVAGGIKITETSSDLAVCLSVASAFFDKAVPAGTIAVGEVGLLGEVREVVAQAKRIKEAKRLGFPHPITSSQIKYINDGVKILRKK